MAVSPGSACMCILDGGHFTLLYFSFPDADADTGMQAGVPLVCINRCLQRRASTYRALRNKDWLALKIAMPKLERPHLLLDNLQISGALLKGVIVSDAIRLLLTTQLSTLLF